MITKLLLFGCILLLIVKIESQLVPFLTCTTRIGDSCTSVWGYSNAYNTDQIVPLFNNKFNPPPIYRNQPTVFKASTTEPRSFNTTTSCSSNVILNWSLTDPITGQTRTATSNTSQISGDSCSPLVINCNQTDNVINDRLAFCQSKCNGTCPYCAQVYSYCSEFGFISSNFTLENCILVGLGFNLVTSGCNYSSVVDNCCSQPQPPVVPPVAPPVSTCPNVTVNSCSTFLTCPKYTLCDQNQCRGNQGIACFQDSNCISQSCNSTNCRCDQLCNECPDFNCGCNGSVCSNNQCVPNPYPCTTSNDCGFLNPYCQNGFCYDYSCTQSQCSNVQIPVCIGSPLNCPTNSVCDTLNAYCVGSHLGQCISDGDCNPVYDCIQCNCTYNLPNALPSALVNICDFAPTLNCNQTVSVALAESITAPFDINCLVDQILQDSPVAYVALPIIPNTMGSVSITSETDSTPFARIAEISFCSLCTSNTIINFNANYQLNTQRAFILNYPNPKFSSSYGAIYNITLTCTSN